MRTAGERVTQIGMYVDGQPVVAEPEAGTILFRFADGRLAITAPGDGTPISLSLTPFDTSVQDRAMADARVRAAALLPPTPRSERPSARQRAVRHAARQYHQSVWQHGYSEGQARFAAAPLNERVTEADVPALVELAVGAVLADPVLRAQMREALDAAELESATR